MISSIEKEIMLAPVSAASAEPVETVYFGGGTPSILHSGELAIMINALKSKFALSPGAEITLEGNPDDISRVKLHEWQELGINRLSLGIQSFLPAELEWMNRAHSATEASECIDLIKSSGFNNYSVDLIYGSPLLSDEDWKKNVMTVINKDIPHISCYALTVEPKTALAKMIDQHKKKPVDAERQASQFLLLMEWMHGAGYEHYEISNFAKPGMRSRHNSSYWQGKPYYGFGPSAHSFDGLRRRWNVANNALYTKSLDQNIIPFEEETLTVTQQLNEYVMISLRTTEGINLNKVRADFGTGAAQSLIKSAEKWQAGEKLLLRDNQLMLTTQGKLFADGIAADLFT
jgi:oxygen-independent coproporphyrinogen-3 oxidase